MHPDFWHERWQRGEIGWHRDDINVHLQEHWHRVGAEPGTQVLVPLCGKTRDLLWLAAQGHPVLGVEISAIAVEAFFSDNALSPAVNDQGAFRRYAVDELEILRGDFFDLTPAQVSRVGAIYDRASLIALPPAMRPLYAEHLQALTKPGTQGLLITLEYRMKWRDRPSPYRSPRCNGSSGPHSTPRRCATWTSSRSTQGSRSGASRG